MARPRTRLIPPFSGLLTVFARAMLVSGSLPLTGCETEVAGRDYALTLRVLSDPGEPLAGATASRGRVALGVTDAEGRLAMNFRGKEGERLTIDVACPDGYRSPEAPVTVTLRRALDRIPEYEARCPPLRRKLVVAVRAERGANLPIRYLNREIARTDEAGAALVMLESFTDDTLELTLDTSTESRLLPRSPSTRFRMPDHDEIVVLNQRFELEPTTPHKVRRHRASAPVRIE